MFPPTPNELLELLPFLTAPERAEMDRLLTAPPAVAAGRAEPPTA